MSVILQLGTAVRARRREIGLSQAELARLSGLSRQTISELEGGTIKDLSLKRAERLANVLGLNFQLSGGDVPARRMVHRMTPLSRASRTASVSYRKRMAPARLRNVLVKGESAPADIPYVHALLDDAPVSLLASVADQLQDGPEGAARIWQNYRKLARQVKSNRDLWK